jgi:hypothetical protein
MALSRIAQACSCAGPSIEVIVRDNSGIAEKRAQLARFQSDHCTVIFAEPCGPLENFSATIRLAKGDFIFCLADDDMFFNGAIAALPALLEHVRSDPDVTGVAGNYIVDSSRGTSLVTYQNIDSEDVTARIAGYLAYPGANVLAYAPLRRATVETVFRFVQAMPLSLSYHDQIVCLLYLLHGRFPKLPKLIYGYDFGPWEELQSAQKRDAAFYKAAGLDPAINKLHWFLCGFEGALLIRNGDGFPDHPAAQRQKMADEWFSTMFVRFAANPRFAFESRFEGQAEALCQKLRASQGHLSFVGMLSDICHFIALFSPAKAQAYLSFWGALVKPRRLSA